MKFPFYDSSNRTTSPSAEPKQMCNISIFNTEPTFNWCFLCIYSVILSFFLKYLPHTWQCNALNVFSTWIFTWIQLMLLHLWTCFQDEIVNEKTFTKQTPNCFELLVEDIKKLDIFYKIQNFLGTLWASIITTYLIKLLSTGPLQFLRPMSFLSPVVFFLIMQFDFQPF